MMKKTDEQYTDIIFVILVSFTILFKVNSAPCFIYILVVFNKIIRRNIFRLKLSIKLQILLSSQTKSNYFKFSAFIINIFSLRGIFKHQQSSISSFFELGVIQKCK